VSALTIATLASLALGALTLFLGLRGKRIDQEPRCPARRCKYALGGVISAKRANNDDPFPLTCPECGRTITHERSLRIGTLRRIKPAIALGVALLLPSSGYLAFEGYARWQSTNAITTMPLWLLLYQAPSDSSENNWTHQREIFRRAILRQLDNAQSQRVIDRLLRWQRDPHIDVDVIARVLAPFQEQGVLSQAQLDQFWEQINIYELRVRDPAVPGAILPLEIRRYFRGGHAGSAPRPSDVNLMYYSPLIVQELRVGDKVIDLSREVRALQGQLDPRPALRTSDWAWPAHAINVWKHITVPADASDTIEVFVRLQEGHAYTNQPTIKPNTVELRRQVAVAKQPRTQVTVDDPTARAWLTQKLQASSLSFQDNAAWATLGAPVGIPPIIVRSDVYFIGDVFLRCVDRDFGPFPFEVQVNSDKFELPRIQQYQAKKMISLAESELDNWEIIFVPRPERAATRVDDIEVLGGEPIIVPLRISTTGTREAIQLLQDERDGAQPLPR
jgi:hypothetical protein